ncbi:glycoside hydrolase family 51 protein [Mycena pura]|uniref:non-reducing end alpha-L-arabinofuranosidase n=1 Tax=Mycena pura TaxID=153505 RepID=A0AAD6V9Z5_9AGAR|nr:glycoside hydrolase family 51 protein [Mycena pura]
MATIRIDPARHVAPVDPRIYSGFTEHMGRCIYGGIYDPGNAHGLSDARGYRTDVLQALKDLNVPVIRYPGGNFVSSYRWQDGVGPKDQRPRRPELAWLTEESNQFGTDEFIEWCRLLGAEPYICLNMGTGTLDDALGWLEYCNSSANTHYANMRRANGHNEPYGVKYWALGNEMWGPWQGAWYCCVCARSLTSRARHAVGQMTAEDYAKKAFQWAKALRLLDPTIKLVSCGETGFAGWDRVTLKTLAPVVDFHSIHLYTVSKGAHDVNVMGPAAAEKGIEITKALIELSQIEGDLDKDIAVCFDEWNVWDPVRAPGEKGAEEHYDLSDALAVAAWLNVFVRKADVVKIACIAQSVNVISPIITSPSGLFKQTTYYALQLFATLMQGTALAVHVDGDAYTGPTEPAFVARLSARAPPAACPTRWVDASAVLAPGGTQVRLALLNRHAARAAGVTVHFGPGAAVGARVTVHELWSAELGDRNGFGAEKIATRVRTEAWSGVYEAKAHSFQVVFFSKLVHSVPRILLGSIPPTPLITVNFILLSWIVTRLSPCYSRRLTNIVVMAAYAFSSSVLLTPTGVKFGVFSHWQQ